MPSAVCTLFEGNYHFGVAVLANSLYKTGFRGSIYAGYKGELPVWTTSAKLNPSLLWEGSCTLEIQSDFQIHFLPIDTDYHLTNYKPHFMLDLWAGPAKENDGIVYFDPDIVNTCIWSFYESWVGFGIALVHEAVSNDMPANHPKRMQWNLVAESAGYKMKNNLSSYINAGFIGVNKDRVNFLKLWKHFIEHSILHFNLIKSNFNQSSSNVSILNLADQDLLNLTAMCTDELLSEMGPESMGFIGGGWVMLHATGSPKPWNKNFISLSIKGKPPSTTDKIYWSNCLSPIQLFNTRQLKSKNICIKIASFIGKFYRNY